MPMNAKEFLDHVAIPVPCSRDWDKMSGDERARYCEFCGKHVYDISRMTVDAAPFLTLAEQGELCGRVTLSADGTVVTADERHQSQRPAVHWQFRIRSFMAVIAGVAAMLGFARLFPSPSQTPPILPVPAPNVATPLHLMGKIVPQSNRMPPPRSAPAYPFSSEEL
jgi:hypothetical protein